MRKLRYLTAALCAVVLLCGFTLPAYASGGEAWEDVETVTKEPVQTAEPTPAPTVEPTPEPAATPSPEPTPAASATPADKPTTGTTGKKPVTSTPVSTSGTDNKGKSAAPTDKAPEDDETTGGNTGAPTGSSDPVGKGGATERADFGGSAAEGAQAEFVPTREGLTPVNLLTPDGQGTLLDNATGEEGKEFFTITTADESVFYLVIDRQKSGENVYFLNTVTVDDLMALAEPGKEEPPAPAVTPEPEPAPTPDVEPEPEPEPEKTGGSMGTLLLALAVVVIGGGAGWYFKIYRPKQQRAADLEEDDYPDGPEPGFEDGYDDTPPWDEGDGE